MRVTGYLAHNNMALHNDLGKDAEDFAAEFLIRNQYRILEKNWRYGKAEIDIIAIDKSSRELVIVEVKSLVSDKLRNPEEAVNKSKKKLIISAANEYVSRNAISLETRFDIISLVKKKEWAITHIKNAFMAYE